GRVAFQELGAGVDLPRLDDAGRGAGRDALLPLGGPGDLHGGADGAHRRGPRFDFTTASGCVGGAVAGGVSPLSAARMAPSTDSLVRTPTSRSFSACAV